MAMWMHKAGYFHICAERNGSWNVCNNTEKFGSTADATMFKLPGLYHFKITMINQRFRIELNGKTLFEDTNNWPITHEKFLIYIAGNRDPPLDCLITDFHFETYQNPGTVGFMHFQFFKRINDLKCLEILQLVNVT